MATASSGLTDLLGVRPNRSCTVVWTWKPHTHFSQASLSGYSIHCHSYQPQYCQQLPSNINSTTPIKYKHHTHLSQASLSGYSIHCHSYQPQYCQQLPSNINSTTPIKYKHHTHTHTPQSSLTVWVQHTLSQLPATVLSTTPIKYKQYYSHQI